ncbi:MAG: hypothetical protein QF415_15465 [Candidatus Undinarchaeales archaeon]|jgi:uncharacterized BrkB/YihY/UPF0761 family membrane protein|nr:hypothetical protein [Candidatus Undinarchaeales archaeon]MDP7492810.1 hypothetical protein [Candidatus Undinarchaeales archaeon]
MVEDRTTLTTGYGVIMAIVLLATIVLTYNFVQAQGFDRLGARGNSEERMFSLAFVFLLSSLIGLTLGFVTLFYKIDHIRLDLVESQSGIAERLEQIADTLAPEDVSETVEKEPKKTSKQKEE